MDVNNFQLEEAAMGDGGCFAGHALEFPSKADERTAQLMRQEQERNHALSVEQRAADCLLVVFHGCLAALFVFVIGMLILRAYSSPTTIAHDASAKEYDTYVLNAGLGTTVTETEAGARLDLPQGVVYYITTSAEGWYAQFRLGYGDERGRMLKVDLHRIPASNLGMFYGDVDLLAEAGIPYKLQVVRADWLLISYSVVPLDLGSE